MKFSWQLFRHVIHDAGKVYDGRARYLKLFNVIRKCERIYRSKKSKDTLPERHAKAAQVIKDVCQQNGAMWIKVAQYLSCRPDVMPIEYVQIFSELQTLPSSHTTCGFQTVIHTLIEAWGADWDKEFKTFDIIPVASGSIAQVYKARLIRENEESLDVAVKIRVPGVEALYEQDAIVLKAAAKCIEPFYKEFDISSIIAEIIETTMLELNFKHEADNIQLYQSKCDDRQLKTPAVIEELSCEKILCTEWVSGPTLKSIITANQVNTPYILPKVRRFALAMLKDIFIHGQYHGDPHPGNILIAEQTYLIDFGLMGTLSDIQKTTYLFLLMAMTGKVNTPDYRQLFVNAGFIAEDEQIFEEVGYLILDLHQDDGMNLNTRLEAVMQSLRQNKVILPQGFVGILRVILLLSGLFYSADISFEDIFCESLAAA